jgi:hypothetical protein
VSIGRRGERVVVRNYGTRARSVEFVRDQLARLGLDSTGLTIDAPVGESLIDVAAL